MFGLLCKDIHILKKDLIILFLEMIVFFIALFLPWGEWLDNTGGSGELINGYSMTYVIMPVISFGAMAVFISMAQDSIFNHDERKVWAYYVMASPLAHKGQVLSKYFLVAGLSALMLVWGMMCDMLCPVTTGIKGSSMTIYTFFFFAQIFIKSIELPFIIRFGSKHGKIYKILIGIGMVYLFIIYCLFGPLPDISSDMVFEYFIFKLTNQDEMSTAMLGTLAIAPYVIVLMYYLSYKVSCRLFIKGVSEYES